MVTAGHCVLPLQLGAITAADYRITFDAAPQTIFHPERPAPVYYQVLAGTTYPDYASGAMTIIANAKPTYATEPDVAVLRLTEPVPAAVATPAAIVAENALDGAKGLTMTAVGYGANGFLRGVLQWDAYRYFAPATVISDNEVTSRLFLKASSVTCSGDSGGPLLLDGRVAGVTSFGQSMHCMSPGFWTRLDTPQVQAFLTAPGV